MSKVNIKFDGEYEAEGKMISEVSFRNPVAKDLYGVKFSDEASMMEATAVVASRLSGYPKPLYDNLSITDFTKVAEAIGPLLMGGMKN